MSDLIQLLPKDEHNQKLEANVHPRDYAGLGHVSEIADGDPPHTPRGCPFQAWSLGEFIRLTQVVLRSKSAGSSENSLSRPTR